MPNDVEAMDDDVKITSSEGSIKAEFKPPIILEPDESTKISFEISMEDMLKSGIVRFRDDVDVDNLSEEEKVLYDKYGPKPSVPDDVDTSGEQWVYEEPFFGIWYGASARHIFKQYYRSLPWYRRLWWRVRNWWGNMVNNIRRK